MQLGTELQNRHCARCHQTLTIPAVYRDHAWYHASCWQDGARQLANATRLATAFRFQSHLPMIHHIYSDTL
jgi:hypothetical protein